MDLHWDIYNPESEAPVILALGATLGGNSTYQWTAVAERLRDVATVAFVDLPGHALSPLWDEGEETTLDAVASGFMRAIREIRDEVGAKPVVFAGLSISGATALHMARDHADELAGVAVLASAATVGEESAWLQRAERVDAEGKGFLLEETEKRWFTPAFRAKQSSTVGVVMESLAGVNDYSYAQLCRALAVHDVRNDLEDIRLPLLLIAGERDTSTPIANVELVAESVPGAELHVISDVAHQISIAAPGDVAVLLLNFLQRVSTPPRLEQNDD